MQTWLTAVVAALIAGSIALVPSARADSADRIDTELHGTATLTLANPGQLFTDAEGNRYFHGLVYSGQLTGWPVSGTLRIDANITFPAGSLRGEIDGSFVISDGAGSALHGDLSESRVQQGPSGLLIAARLHIEGGTGLFDDARGSVRIAGSLPIPGGGLGQLPVAPPGFAGPVPMTPGPATLAVSGHLSLSPSADVHAWWSQNPPGVFPDRESRRAFHAAVRDFLTGFDDDVRPGFGWGDRNHDHVGPPGQRDRSDERPGRGRGRGRD